jgi:hypothetical protein
MSRSQTRANLSGGNYLHVVNVLMQLRKVCNHPNLFAEPDVASSFTMNVYPIGMAVPPLVIESLRTDPKSGIRNVELSTTDTVDLRFLNLCLLHNEVSGGAPAMARQTASTRALIAELDSLAADANVDGQDAAVVAAALPFYAGGDSTMLAAVAAQRLAEHKEKMHRRADVNEYRTNAQGTVVVFQVCGRIGVV